MNQWLGSKFTPSHGTQTGEDLLSALSHLHVPHTHQTKVYPSVCPWLDRHVRKASHTVTQTHIPHDSDDTIENIPVELNIDETIWKL
jgi:hypothetical protein